MQKIFIIIFTLVFSVAAFTAPLKNNDKYLLGVGDVVKVTVYGHDDLTLETQIGNDGTINFPLIGAVSLKDTTFTQAESLIGERLKLGGFINNPQVNILIEEYKSQRISVIGEVNHPGRYALDGKTTLVDMIANAGGVSPMGGDTVVIIRNGIQQEYYLPHLMSKGEIPPSLESGDQIYIPRMQQVYVYGEVMKPGAYRMEPHMTVMQAIAVAGGFTPKASHRSIELQRPAADGSVDSRDVKLTEILKPNDVIYVEESLF